MLINLSRMKVPHRWFLTFGSSNKGHDYPFRTEVTDLHLHGTMRRIGCRVRVQSKSALQWALHIRCDIARTYLFRCLCISQVPHHHYRRVIILGQCHGSCSLFRCEGCGTSAQRTQLTLPGCHAKSLIPLLPPPPMMPTWPAPPYARATTSRLLRRSQMTMYPVLLDDTRTCCTCRFHDMDVVSSSFDKHVTGE